MGKEFVRIPYEEYASNPEKVFERVTRERKAIVVEKPDGARVVLRCLSKTGAPRHRRLSAGSADEAFRSAFGGWKDIVDGERLKKDIAKARGSRRASVEL